MHYTTMEPKVGGKYIYDSSKGSFVLTPSGSIGTHDILELPSIGSKKVRWPPPAKT